MTVHACFGNESRTCTPSFLPNNRKLRSYFLRRFVLQILEQNNSVLLTYFSQFIRTFHWSQIDINIPAFPWVEIYTYLPCTSQNPQKVKIFTFVLKRLLIWGFAELDCIDHNQSAHSRNWGRRGTTTYIRSRPPHYLLYLISAYIRRINA